MDDAETVPEPEVWAGAVTVSLAAEADSFKVAITAAVAWTSLHLLKFPLESVFTT